MNRRETMEEVSKHRYDEMELGKDSLTRELREKCRKVAILAFQDGADVADKTMIERACEYLRSLKVQEFPGGPMERVMSEEDIAAFKKAMEE